MDKSKIEKPKIEDVEANINCLSSQQITDLINNIWDLVINGFFLGDIENLERIILAPGKKYGLAAVGQLLSITSMLELLGKTLYDGDDLLYFKNQDKAWEYYFNHYMPNEYKGLDKPIQNLIRNGAAHLFLPREVGLSKRPHERLFFEEDGTLIFNVTTFTKLFKDSLILVKKDLDDNHEISKRFLIRYEMIRLTNQKVDADCSYSTIIKKHIDSVTSVSPHVVKIDPSILYPPTTVPVNPFPTTTTLSFRPNSDPDNNSHSYLSDK